MATDCPGNLAGITSTLNRPQSKTAWIVKRTDITKSTHHNLTQHFHDPMAERCEERDILKLTAYLFGLLKM